MGVTVQGEHDGPEEDRSDPEGRGARGPARPDVWSSGEEEHERTRPSAVSEWRDASGSGSEAF